MKYIITILSLLFSLCSVGQAEPNKKTILPKIEAFHTSLKQLTEIKVLEFKVDGNALHLVGELQKICEANKTQFQFLLPKGLQERYSPFTLHLKDTSLKEILMHVEEILNWEMYFSHSESDAAPMRYFTFSYRSYLYSSQVWIYGGIPKSDKEKNERNHVRYECYQSELWPISFNPSYDEYEHLKSNQQVESIVTTPGDKVEAQSTQAHP